MGTVRLDKSVDELEEQYENENAGQVPFDEVFDAEGTKKLATFEVLAEGQVEDFPLEVLQYSEESDKHYQFFQYYMLMGPGNRSLANLHRAFYPKVQLNTDGKRGSAATSTYLKLIGIRKQFEWDKRAFIWDKYIQRRTLIKIAALQTELPVKAWQTLDFLLDKAVKEETKLRAAEAVLDRTGYPRETSQIVDKTVRNIKQLSDDDLRQIITGFLDKKELADKSPSSQLASPIIGQKALSQPQSDDVIEGEVKVPTQGE